MAERYWLVLPNGGRQLIDPNHFDIDALVERAARIGGRIVVEGDVAVELPKELEPNPSARRFEPPISALAPLFRSRLNRLYFCKLDFDIDMNVRPTARMLGGYYWRRCLVRVYTHDRHAGRRPMEELFDTFLHEVAHHLEYTEPESFQSATCQRVRGMMHSPLFWRILGHLKRRWAELQTPQE
ncbi:MAG: hypothetical protein JWN86_1132 [Planctomycetota bacterium]|nr:hypothetical protein [Planctomycetota bacterium]